MSDDGISFWTIKPSEILKLFLANPKYSKDLMRFVYLIVFYSF